MIGKIKKAVWISRPFAWLFGPVAYAFGVFASGSSFTFLNTIQMLVLSFPLAFYVNGINDVYDIHTDRINPRRTSILFGRPLDERDIPFVKRGSLAAILLVLASTLLFWNPLHTLVALLFLPVPYLYSAPPLRLKSRPILDSLVNFAVAFGPFALGFSSSGSLGFLALHFIIFSFTFSAAHALGTIWDMEEDRLAGIRTFAAVYGPRLPALFAGIIFALNIPFAFRIMMSAGIMITLNAILSFLVVFKNDRETVKKVFVVMMVLFVLWVVFVPLSRFLGIEHTNYFWLYGKA